MAFKLDEKSGDNISKLTYIGKYSDRDKNIKCQKEDIISLKRFKDSDIIVVLEDNNITICYELSSLVGWLKLNKTNPANRKKISDDSFKQIMNRYNQEQDKKKKEEILFLQTKLIHEREILNEKIKAIEIII